MEARSIRKHIRTSPRKMRTVINVVRGRSVPEALDILNFLPQQVTAEVKTTIMSAVHNLMDKNPEERFDENDLVVSLIKVDEGPMFKRFRPAPRGRAHRIRKRTSHLTVVVSNSDSEEKADD